MWIKQVLQQEMLTDIARQKAMMQAGSIEKFMLPKEEIQRRWQMTRDQQRKLQLHAMTTISWWWRRRVRFKSKMELLQMGIGDPG
mmetsp:Transcript_1509/g.2347  ORF Transcript_1509/g.2347 Transcript_1509/m.2347 type:complete len:85 (-) Transcript_1509:235-489(-)